MNVAAEMNLASTMEGPNRRPPPPWGPQGGGGRWQTLDAAVGAGGMAVRVPGEQQLVHLDVGAVPLHAVDVRQAVQGGQAAPRAALWAGVEHLRAAEQEALGHWGIGA
jgi:hypothetical protein